MDRAYDGAAYAFGGTIEREPLQGYMPILHRGADKVMEESVKLLDVSYRCSKPADFNNACTDVGDLTHLFPVLNFTFGGFAENFTEQILRSWMKNWHISNQPSFWH